MGAVSSVFRQNEFASKVVHRRRAAQDPQQQQRYGAAHGRRPTATNQVKQVVRRIPGATAPTAHGTPAVAAQKLRRPEP
jgi:hypothetical protein